MNNQSEKGNASFFGITSQSNQKRFMMRMEAREKYIQQLFRNKRQNHQTHSSNSDNIDIISEADQRAQINKNINSILSSLTMSYENIQTLWQILLNHPDYVLDKQHITRLIDISFAILKDSYQNPSNQRIQKSRQNSQKLTVYNENQMKNSTCNYSGNKLEKLMKYLQKFLFMLINQTCRDQWQSMGMEINTNLISLCFKIIDMVIESDSTSNPNYKSFIFTPKKQSQAYDKQDRFANISSKKDKIILLSIIILGNLCLSIECVQQILDRNGINIIIYDLIHYVEPEFYEDLSFLIANLLYHYPQSYIVPFLQQNEDSNEQIDNREILQIKKNWQQLFGLFKFLLEKLNIQLKQKHESTNRNQEKNMKLQSKNKIIKFKNNNSSQKIYYIHDLIDGITKINYMIYSYFQVINRTPNIDHEQLRNMVVNLVTQVYPIYQQTLRNTAGAISIVAMNKNKQLLQSKQQGYFLYLTAQHGTNKNAYTQSTRQLCDFLRFIRDTIRLPIINNISSSSKYYSYKNIALLNQQYTTTTTTTTSSLIVSKINNNKTIDEIYNCIFTHDCLTLVQQQIKINQYCWQIIDDNISGIVKYLQNIYNGVNNSVYDNNNQQQYIQYRILCEQLDILQKWTINNNIIIAQNQQCRATTIYFKYCHIKYKLPVMFVRLLTSYTDRNRQNKQNRQNSNNIPILMCKLQVVRHLLPIIRLKLIKYTQQHNYSLVSTILECFATILNQFTCNQSKINNNNNYSNNHNNNSNNNNQQQKRRYNGLNQLLDQSQHNSKSKSKIQKINNGNKCDYKYQYIIFMKDLYDQYRYKQLGRDDQYIQDILELFQQILNANETEQQ